MPSKKQTSDSSQSTLVIVESPTKAKTISRFLGEQFIVQASFGHVRDLPKSKIGIDVKENFTPSYVIPTKAKPVIADLKTKAKHAAEVILATDEDREGEAISWHLATALALPPEKTKRIVFHEITKTAIEHALANPRTIDMNLVDAQQARRILDRLVGYELSPFLWRKVRYGLSAGRVQSVAVRLIVEREREIQKFVQQEYWSIETDFTKNEKGAKPFHAHLTAAHGKPLEKMAIASKEEADKLIDILKKESYTIQGIETKTVNRNPAAPFTTSTLQQEASRKFGFSASQTMVLAQQLYEGIEIGGTQQGLITYMRTDSVNLAASAIAVVRELIATHYGKEYALETPRSFTTRSKGAQEAHEAIRPTDPSKTPDTLSGYLDRNQLKLYSLIWKRTIACQMAPAALEQKAIDIASKNNAHTFRATGQTILFDGFMRAYTEDEDDKEEEKTNILPKDIAEGDAVNPDEIMGVQHFTSPPPRYSDATLIKALEAHGIGRPSTYAPTLTTIQYRGYVEKIEKKYQPTEIGTLVNDILIEHFPEIVDIDFTSKIEKEFDDIAEGTMAWTDVLHEFYDPFKKHLDEKEATVAKQTEISDTPCPHCGKMMIIKFGRMGKFLACPEEGSKVTLPMPEEAAQIKALEEKTKDERCPLCGKAMAVKRGRFGFFLGCTNYPTCKGISKIWNKVGFPCPACEMRKKTGEPGATNGELAEKKGRGRGKPFYGCTRYPDCTFVTNTKPESAAQLQELYEYWKANPPKPRTQKWGKKKSAEEPAEK